MMITNSNYNQANYFKKVNRIKSNYELKKVKKIYQC